MSEKELDLGPIEARYRNGIDLQSSIRFDPDMEIMEQVNTDIAALVAEVKRLRGEGLKEYAWSCYPGQYLGGFDFIVVAESLQQALDYARKRLSDYELKDILKQEPDISDVEVKESGYYEYHMDVGG